MGYDITVITAFPHYVESHTQTQKPVKFFERQYLNGVEIVRTYIYPVSKGALWKRLLYHGSYNIFATLAMLGLKKPDIILADAPTLWSGLPLLIRAFFSKIPFIYVVHDIYPDVLSRLGILSNPALINLIDKVERFYYQKASAISVLSNGFKDNLLSKGVPEDKIAIIPVCVDVEFIQPLPRENKFRKEWELDGKFVVLYAGNIGLSQGLEIMLEAAEMLNSHPEVVFVLVGDGARKPELQELAERNGLANVKFFPFQPREDVPYIYAMADVCLVSLKRDIVIESVPSKTYSIMSAGRPIIATVDQNTEVGRLIEAADCGICIEPENPGALSSAIVKLYEDEELKDEMGRRAREHVVQKYSRTVAANEYHEKIQLFADRK
jgi:colanic acid biosynthesis glycosyl transferase WcaI